MNMMVVMAPEEPMSTIIFANLSDIIFLVSNAIKGQYILVENTALMVEGNTCLDSLGNTPPILLSIFVVKAPKKLMSTLYIIDDCSMFASNDVR
jgi:hypothetical protein